MSASPNPFADDPQPPEQVRLHSAADPLNPYAAPAGIDAARKRQPGVGIWRDGPLVVMHERATFPDRCVFTNEPSEIRRRQKVAWSYAIDVTSRFLELHFGVCEAKQRQIVRRRGQWIKIGMLCALPGVIAISLIGLGYVSCTALIVFGLSLLVSVLAFERVWRAGDLFHFHSVKDSYFWLKGAEPPFLDSLPDWPGSV